MKMCKLNEFICLTYNLNFTLNRPSNHGNRRYREKDIQSIS